ncbi:MAG: ABC transporter ATP-binding protein [Halobaculum sp.]
MDDSGASADRFRSTDGGESDAAWTRPDDGAAGPDGEATRPDGGAAQTPGAVRLAFDVRAQFGGGNRSADDGFELAVAGEVAAGETLAVLGPSGSGKTLLVETLGGFHDHEGWVELGDSEVTDAPPEDRPLGMVFQDGALFPHLTVRENVAFGAPYHDTTRDPDAILDRLGIADTADRRPATLSGGERGRVALARAVAVDPPAMVLDEPLTALDPPTRRRLRGDLAETLADRTAVVVTHDRTTARVLGDRVIVVADGRVRQRGPPADVFRRPETVFVARFVGCSVLPAGTVRDGPVAVRPESVTLCPPDEGRSAGVVSRVERTDATHRVVVRLDHAELTAFADDPPAVGDRVGVRFPDGTIPLEETDDSV